MAARRDLIKVLFPLSPQEVVVEVLGGKGASPGKEKLRFDNSPEELFQGHAVVVKKAGEGHGCGSQDTQPAGHVLAYDRPQAQVEAGSQPHGGHSTKELPGGQPEKDGLLMLAYFFRNFDLDSKSPHNLAKI